MVIEVLTDLSFLDPGSKWPPPDEAARLKKYAENRLLFEGEHNKVYKDWVRLLREDRQAILEIILNWHKRLSLLWADLLLSETPTIASKVQKSGERKSKEQKEIEAITEKDFFNILYETVIDISRYGTGILNIYSTGQNGVISSTPPSIWFPVVSEDNIKIVLFHVLAWIVTSGKITYLKVQIHDQGKYEIRKYLLQDGVIKRQVEAPQVRNTGLDDFAIIPIHNVVTSDTIYGMDDYSDLDSILQEMEIRIAQISRILDKHSDPNMYGDEEAMEEDEETGEVKFRGGGKFFPVSQGGVTPGYIVWDAQLEANWKELEFLLSQLYILSETSSACFGDLKQGNAESGAALRRLMLAALAKTQRIRLRMDPAVKKALRLCASLDGVDMKNSPISITWKDGLPRDDREDAEIMAIRTGSTGGARTISVHTAIGRLDNLTDEEVEQEMERIQEDEYATVPTATPPYSGDNRGEIE